MINIVSNFKIWMLEHLFSEVEILRVLVEDILIWKDFNIWDYALRHFTFRDYNWRWNDSVSLEESQAWTLTREEVRVVILPYRKPLPHSSLPGLWLLELLTMHSKWSLLKTKTKSSFWLKNTFFFGKLYMYVIYLLTYLLPQTCSWAFLLSLSYRFSSVPGYAITQYVADTDLNP